MIKITSVEAKQINKVLSRSAEDSSSEQRLWMAVITQAVTDLSRFSRARKSDSIHAKDAEKIVHGLAYKAHVWIFGGSEGFRDVCTLAGTDPAYVHLLIKNIETHKAAA